MEQQSSTSTVTVEYFDPHDVYKLLAPGLVPRLPLHNLHWQSHSGPLRSIDTLHVELVQGGKGSQAAVSTPTPRQSGSTVRDDGFQTQNVGGTRESVEAAPVPALRAAGSQRRHQIPGLRRTPYLKLLLVRCDDNDSYKSTVRSEVREWIKTHVSVAGSSKKTSGQENHDAFEWLIVHVVIPNTAAATQPRGGSKSEGASEKSATSRWRTGTTPLMEKFRSDFNGPTKGSLDHVAQIRIGINDLPYDLLPRVVPAVPTGYSETGQDAESAWEDLVGKLKSLILNSFDMRVSQYEEDVRERDAQRSLPGWNFCTFFILKEGLAMGFENVGLVEDALVGYDELSIGLDAVVHEQLETGSPESHGGAMLTHTEELRALAEKALAMAIENEVPDEETVDLQSKDSPKDPSVQEITISSTRKAYRDLILENKVSVFDFRCYIFARQISLLLRLGNASSSKEELLAQLKSQQESVLRGEAPLALPRSTHKDDPENLTVFADICQRTLHFIPTVSQTLRGDLLSALQASESAKTLKKLAPSVEEVVDNIVSTFAFSVAQQILAQTSTKALPIPPSTLSFGDGHEPKSSIPEPKTMIHPARNSSLLGRGGSASQTPLSPGFFPGPGMQLPPHGSGQGTNNFFKAGLEELAARRAELYMLSRSILTSLGRKRGWNNGWNEAPIVGEPGLDKMEEINLDGDASKAEDDDKASESLEDDDDGEGETLPKVVFGPSMAGIDSHILRTATHNSEDFYRLYEILTDKAMRHFTVANYEHAVQSSMADLAVMKFYLKDQKGASYYFGIVTPFFGDRGWSLLELSMLSMYLQCLDEMESKTDYVSVALTLLTKYCAAEKERWQDKSRLLGISRNSEFPDESFLKGVIKKLTLLAKSVPSEVKVSLVNFFTDVELGGAPEYPDGQDGCSLEVNLRSLLPEEISFDSMSLRISSVDGGPGKERIFEKKGDGAITLAPGKNSVKLGCRSAVAGRYKVDQLILSSQNLTLQFQRDASAPTPNMTDIFKDPDVVLFQRTNTFDVTMSATKHTSLDKENSLDLEIFTGWNSVKTVELRVKPATGGLRFLTKQAEFVESSMTFAKPPEAGIFCFNAIAAETTVLLRFPYSVEQDVADVFAKLEVTYVVESGESYFLAKYLAVPVALTLNVNVQDVFKHGALFSRFNVSTATSSPLRLLKSDLLGTDLFDAAFGVPPSNPIIVFPKQPASLMYRVTRKSGSTSGNRAARTMYLKIYYSLLETEVQELVRLSISEALEAASLKEFSKLVISCVWREIKSRLQPRDLERAALLGEFATAYLEEVDWESHFKGIGRVSGLRGGTSTELTAFVQSWQKTHFRMPLPASSAAKPLSILIPVEIPSLSVVHTADIRLQTPIPGPVDNTTEEIATVCVNQMLPAKLHLKWTRVWDTTSTHGRDQEFSYEVTAPADVWLLGGRRKGHFVIPGSSMSETLSSTPETEAEIPLVLIPLREGWLPYPTVEIREIPIAEGDGQTVMQSCEVDMRNLGETVRVVGNRSTVTVSLDASGPGGGPLVFEGEGMANFKGRVVA